MKITRQEVRHVADLARLSFSEEELEEFSGQLDTILSYVEKLNELDTRGIEPTSHVTELFNAFRPDKARSPLPVEEALSNAPEEENGQFVVPRII